jgi:hypothetical protein
MNQRTFDRERIGESNPAAGVSENLRSSNVGLEELKISDCNNPGPHRIRSYESKLDFLTQGILSEKEGRFSSEYIYFPDGGVWKRYPELTGQIIYRRPEHIYYGFASGIKLGGGCGSDQELERQHPGLEQKATVEGAMLRRALLEETINLRDAETG